MKIELQNQLLLPTINFLSEFPAKGKNARAIVKLKKLLIEKVQELIEDERSLVEEFGARDSEGGLIPVDKENPDGDKVIQTKRKEEYWAERQALLEQEVEIVGGTYSHHIDDVQNLLEIYDGEMNGNNAVAYDALLDAFEKVQKEKGGSLNEN